MTVTERRKYFREKFEERCKDPAITKQVVFPLGAMEINGVLSHYMDSDTDSAFIGFILGFNLAEKMAKDAANNSPETDQASNRPPGCSGEVSA